MKIAAHHIKGTEDHELNQRLRATPDYTPKQPWPEDCTVQWGHGIIPRTPFFEVFLPKNFIRGEGKDLEEAEAKAFRQYTRELTCDHQWGRQRPRGDLYTNGAGWCRKCGAFRSNMFKPIVALKGHRRPLNSSEKFLLESYMEDEELNEQMDRKYPEKREERIRNQHILMIRKKLFGELPPYKAD